MNVKRIDWLDLIFTIIQSRMTGFNNQVFFLVKSVLHLECVCDVMEIKLTFNKTHFTEESCIHISSYQFQGKEGLKCFTKHTAFSKLGHLLSFSKKS